MTNKFLKESLADIMDKWDYINKIIKYSECDNEDYLLDIMDKYNKNSVAEIAYLEAKEFYENMKGRKTYV